MTSRLLVEGDRVRVRNVAGTWRLAELRLVSGEAVVVRGRLRRIVRSDDVEPVTKPDHDGGD